MVLDIDKSPKLPLLPTQLKAQPLTLDSFTCFVLNMFGIIKDLSYRLSQHPIIPKTIGSFTKVKT